MEISLQYLLRTSSFLEPSPGSRNSNLLEVSGRNRSDRPNNDLPGFRFLSDTGVSRCCSLLKGHSVPEYSPLILVSESGALSTACSSAVEVAWYFLLNSLVLLRVVTADVSLDTSVLKDDFQHVMHDSLVQPIVFIAQS